MQTKTLWPRHVCKTKKLSDSDVCCVSVPPVAGPSVALPAAPSPLTLCGTPRTTSVPNPVKPSAPSGRPQRAAAGGVGCSALPPQPPLAPSLPPPGWWQQHPLLLRWRHPAAPCPCGSSYCCSSWQQHFCSLFIKPWRPMMPTPSTRRMQHMHQTQPCPVTPHKPSQTQPGSAHETSPTHRSSILYDLFFFIILVRIWFLVSMGIGRPCDMWACDINYVTSVPVCFLWIHPHISCYCPPQGITLWRDGAASEWCS